MADVLLKNNTGSGKGAPMHINADGSKIELFVIDDMTKFGIRHTDATGTVINHYDVALTQR